MANNPFVDGITNLAIPDSEYGVYMVGHKLAGNLFGRESQIEGAAFLSNMKIGGHVDLVGLCVSELFMMDTRIGGNEGGYDNEPEQPHKQKSLNLTSAKLDSYLQLDRLNSAYSVGLTRTQIGALRAKQLTTDGDLDLHGARINDLVNLKGVRIGTRLVLNNAVIHRCPENVLEGAIITHGYTMSDRTQIPDNLRRALETGGYQRVDFDAPVPSGTRTP